MTWTYLASIYDLFINRLIMLDLSVMSDFATPNENQPRALGWIELD